MEPPKQITERGDVVASRVGAPFDEGIHDVPVLANGLGIGYVETYRSNHRETIRHQHASPHRHTFGSFAGLRRLLHNNVSGLRVTARDDARPVDRRPRGQRFLDNVDKTKRVGKVRYGMLMHKLSLT
nr:hypothetical protein [Micrococcus sp. JXJ CY 30]